MRFIDANRVNQPRTPKSHLVSGCSPSLTTSLLTIELPTKSDHAATSIYSQLTNTGRTPFVPREGSSIETQYYGRFTAAGVLESLSYPFHETAEAIDFKREDLKLLSLLFFSLLYSTVRSPISTFVSRNSVT